MEAVKRCMDCDVETIDQDDHWADCEEAPEFVRFQAKAERRAKAGGPLAPSSVARRSDEIPTARFKCGCFVAHVGRNTIDRGEPFPQDVPCPSCVAKGRL